jgi:adenylylsulfate kinase
MCSKFCGVSNLLSFNGLVSTENRQKLLNQRPLTIWITGLSASGKSTVAYSLESKLYDLGIKSYVLDGDNIRQGINRDLAFSRMDRSENIRRIAEIARLMNDAGLVVICAFISPYIQDRTVAKETIGEDKFVEVYLNTPINICESRDPKLLYKKARLAELREFTGVSSPYESPRAPDISIDTSSISIDEAVMRIMEVYLKRIIL